MSAIDNARLAIDASFDMNGVDAIYYSAYPAAGIPCRVLPAQADVEFGLEMARVVQAKAVFTLRGYAEGVVPVRGGKVEVEGVVYHIEEQPQPDNLRLIFKLECVKA